MRITAAFSRLLDLPGVWVRKVGFEPDRVVVTVALCRRRLRCPKCEFSTRNRESRQHHDSVWRHLDLGVWRLEVHARLRRLRCPEHGALVEGVPFARADARFTRDFENLVAWLATKTDKTATCRLTRIDWHTIGRVIERVAAELLAAEDRLSDLFEISIAARSRGEKAIATSRSSAINAAAAWCGAARATARPPLMSSSPLWTRGDRATSRHAPSSASQRSWSRSAPARPSRPATASAAHAPGR